MVKVLGGDREASLALYERFEVGGGELLRQIEGQEILTTVGDGDGNGEAPNWVPNKIRPCAAVMMSGEVCSHGGTRVCMMPSGRSKHCDDHRPREVPWVTGYNATNSSLSGAGSR